MNPDEVEAGTPTSIWAFDFDGVLCDSARETGMAGWKACESLFKDTATPEAVTALLEQFVQVRPVLETGWEAVLMVHLLHAGTSVEELLTTFQSDMKASTLTAVEMTEADVKAAFKEARTAWIAADIEGWLSMHTFYAEAVKAVQGLVAAAAAAPDSVKVYIITTKGKEFALQLLKAASIAIPEDRVFGLGSGRKGVVLGKIMVGEQSWGQHAPGQARCVFMEDRLDTLFEVKRQRDMIASEKLGLLLADWGYNTQAQREKAAAEPFAVLTQNTLAAAAAEPDLFRDCHKDTLFISDV